MKYLAAFILLGALALSSGCTSLIGIASDEGLKRMTPERRAQYRGALDEASAAVDEAKSKYDAVYDLEGNVIPVDPVPAPEDSE